ncbi:MAG: DNA polymerase III subunit delta' [Desulfotalea sp.]|nr:MAG: DNA polymerase III subunit delta' [Desulfotalea sp.]
MSHSPLCYNHLLGQEKVKQLLGKALTSDRLPHGFLFKGPDGVGKCLYARGLAAAINCKDTTTIGACGNCSSCRKLYSGNHPDYTVIRPDKGAIKIDQVRQLVKLISYPPYESPVRVVVLEDVHAMRREAANSLLKTLEEPPVGNLFILTADSSREVLATLTSRCQVVPFVTLGVDITTTLLMTHGLEETDARILARLSEGSPGVALTLHRDEMVVMWREVVGFLSDPAIHVNRDVGQLLCLAEKIAKLKETLPTFLGLLRLWIRDLLFEETEILTLSGIGIGVKNWSSKELYNKLQAIDRAEQELGRNCNKNLVCEVLLFTLQ